MDADRVAASLGAWLDRLTFADLTLDRVTERLLDSVVEWADGQGWRVYRRAASVVRLPPPMDRQHSVLDVACARPGRPPVVVEVDHTDRRRTVEKLLAEADAGRVPIWLRWGTGRFVAPPEPVRMVTCEVSRRRGPSGTVFSRTVATVRAAPRHSTVDGGLAEPVALPIKAEEPRHR